MLQAEVEETMKRLQNQKGVQGIIIVNAEGIWQMRNVAAVVTYFSLVVMCFRSSMKPNETKRSLLLYLQLSLCALF